MGHVYAQGDREGRHLPLHGPRLEASKDGVLSSPCTDDTVVVMTTKFGATSSSFGFSPVNFALT